MLFPIDCRGKYGIYLMKIVADAMECLKEAGFSGI